MATAATALLTAEEFLALPDLGRPAELVRGKVVPMNVPASRHGQVCSQTVYLLRRSQEDRPTGHVLCNDAGVVTERDPDTVRGADVSYYSYERVPLGPLPPGYLPVAQDVAFEVRSPGDAGLRSMRRSPNAWPPASGPCACSTSRPGRPTSTSRTKRPAF
jgi:hypothetical protein